ncbi:MAG: hypothetical protein JWM00_739 [Candidatus Saccharibacteria bacterium]|nr:hypothetical protein [Candidatus Saccharibacteria bacterium]
MRQRTTIVWLGSITALALAGISGLLLTDQTTIFRVTIILSVAAALLNLLAIPFFLVGLKRFKTELRRAYILLCVGIGIFGLAQVQLPLVNLFHASAWVNTGAVAVPYLIGVICIFWGVRLLAGLLSIKTLWTSGLLALFATVVVSLAASFLPHVTVATDELSYDIALMLSIWNSVFITFAAVLAYKVRQKIGESYTHSINWLFRALVILSFAGWHYFATQLLFTAGDWYYDYSFAIVPFLAGAFALVIAGFTFDSIDVRRREGAVIPLPALATAPKEALTTTLSPSQELEVVLYVTNLVSNPTDIDTALSEIHQIASRTQLGRAPSLEDQKRVDSIYLRLEDYLLHRDPLRVFTRDELHGRIAHRFRLSSTVKTTLWPQS